MPDRVRYQFGGHEHQRLRDRIDVFVTGERRRKPSRSSYTDRINGQIEAPRRLDVLHSVYLTREVGFDTDHSRFDEVRGQPEVRYAGSNNKPCASTQHRLGLGLDRGGRSRCWRRSPPREQEGREGLIHRDGAQLGVGVDLRSGRGAVDLVVVPVPVPCRFRCFHDLAPHFPPPWPGGFPVNIGGSGGRLNPVSG